MAASKSRVDVVLTKLGEEKNKGGKINMGNRIAQKQTLWECLSIYPLSTEPNKVTRMGTTMLVAKYNPSSTTSAVDTSDTSGRLVAYHPI